MIAGLLPGAVNNGCSVLSIAEAAIKLAAAPIVGWSKSTVGGSSVSNYDASRLANSVAASESNPEAINAVSTPTTVPRTMASAIDIASATEPKLSVVAARA